MFPTRIICLTEETTETLYLLGEGDRVVGISGYTVRPPEARQKPKISSFLHARYEKIDDARPGHARQAPGAARRAEVTTPIWGSAPAVHRGSGKGSSAPTIGPRTGCRASFAQGGAQKAAVTAQRRYSQPLRLKPR